jgi:NADPH:quinone reductase-like Zn-dependent oxidoreductase
LDHFRYPDLLDCSLKGICMKALVVDQWGPIPQSLQIKELPSPKPGWGEVRVRMLYSPVNPSDLLMIQGKYGRQPNLPCIPGFEGVGIVEEGKGPLAWRVLGKRVAVLNGDSGNWAQEVVIPAIKAVPVPADIPTEQVASFFVNPATTLAMVTRQFKIPKGAWLIQTGASTAVGLMVARLANKLGFRTLNLVRRKELIETVQSQGGTKTLVTEGDWQKEAKSIIGKDEALFGLDCIGGNLGSEVLSLLGRHGRLQVYGRLSGLPIPVDPGQLLNGMKKVEGFWLSEWVKDQGKLTMFMLFREISRLLRDQTLTTNIGGIFDLADWANALDLAGKPGKPGKVLLKLT